MAAAGMPATSRVSCGLSSTRRRSAPTSPRRWPASSGVPVPDAAGTPRLSHVNAEGEATMVDVSGKEPTVREATASAFVAMSPETVAVVRAGGLSKGDALGVAKIAGIMAAKRTPELIPLCHPLALSKIAVSLALVDGGVTVEATARTRDRTRGELRALGAASVAPLRVYALHR